VVPAFILRRLYTKGSLRNRDDGFEFELKNSLGSGYARAVGPLTVDGEEIPREKVFFKLEEKETSFADVDDENTFGLPLNRTIEISTRGAQLDAGAHQIGMSFTVPGFGNLGFDFTDEVRDAEGPAAGAAGGAAEGA